MSKTDIWMPLFIGDYLADTGRLTTEQHGAYLLLIMDYWRNGPPPDDANVLAQITRLPLDAWSNAQAMLKHFFTIEHGVWRHKRIDAELESAEQNKGKAQAKARAAAIARWKNAPSNAPSNAQAMLEECPSPSPSSITTKAICALPVGFAEFWLAYPVKRGKGAAEKAWKRLRPDLQTVLDAIAIAKRSDQWLKNGGEFIPYPATWLNQRRWEDEEHTGQDSIFAGAAGYGS